MSLCETCKRDAEFIVYASYDVPDQINFVHPHVARYPMPMMMTCGYHLAAVLRIDSEAQASTKQWLIKKVE